MKKLLLFVVLCCLQPKLHAAADSARTKNIYEIVLSAFKGYRICVIDEIGPDSGDPVYIIHIENIYNIKVIRVVGDIITVLEDLRKRQA